MDTNASCSSKVVWIWVQVREYVNPIQVIKFHSLTFIYINTYQGEAIEERNINIINSLNN